MNHRSLALVAFTAAVLTSICLGLNASQKGEYIGLGEKNEMYMQVNYSERSYDYLNNWTRPEIGKIFLIVYIHIANHGYDSLSIDPANFKIEADNLKYSIDGATYELEDVLGEPELETATLLNGDKTFGYLAYQVPTNAEIYKLVYDGLGTNVRFVPENKSEQL
jgi:hypothetical protein